MLNVDPAINSFAFSVIDNVLHVEDIQMSLRLSARRRSIGIKITGGRAYVSAPLAVAMQDVQAFVLRKLPWIKNHLTRQINFSRQQKTSVKHLAAGGSLSFLGRELPLLVATAPTIYGAVLADAIQLSLPAHCQYPAAIRRLIKSLYIDQAERYIREKVLEYANKMGVSPVSIKIREYKSRWGSCNSRRELQFNWLLMQAPRDAVNYVVVHELCHLVHFNHSPEFWRMVGQFCPAYKTWRQWFRLHGAALFIE